MSTGLNVWTSFPRRRIWGDIMPSYIFLTKDLAWVRREVANLDDAISLLEKGKFLAFWNTENNTFHYIKDGEHRYFSRKVDRWVIK